jgi:hypothetical protein
MEFSGTGGFWLGLKQGLEDALEFRPLFVAKVEIRVLHVFHVGESNAVPAIVQFQEIKIPDDGDPSR